MSNIRAPQGYEPFNRDDGFVNLIGPLHWMADDDGLHLGLRIEKHHGNPAGTAHGGLIATLIDMQLPLGARYLLPDMDQRFLFTISLTMDFLGPVRVGDWLYGRTHLLKRTQRMVFAEGHALVNGEIVVRASGSFRISAPMEGDMLDFTNIRAGRI